MKYLSKRQAAVILVSLLAALCACSPRADSAEAPAGAPSIAVINFTGSALRAVYVSPHDSAGWEENVLGRDELADGERADISFSPQEQAAMWDLRVESVNGYSAEWKNLDLHKISTLTLRVDLTGEAVAVAEAE